MPASYHSSLVERQWFFNNLLDTTNPAALVEEPSSMPASCPYRRSSNLVRLRVRRSVAELPTKPSITSVRLSILGYFHSKHILSDHDLKSLHGNPRFEALILEATQYTQKSN